MKKSYNPIMLVMALAIMVSFFLPWISVQSQQVGMFSKLLTGKKQATIDAISGFRVPVLANGKDARLMLSIIKVFNPGVKDADKKSYAVWVVPILAFILYILSTNFGDNKIVNILLGAAGCSIFFIAVYKILITDLDKMVLNVKIEYGLWLVLCGYLGIGLINFIKLLAKNK
ncbi:MAG: hypothetical protein ABIG92_05820 [Candidatus Omnitrophota bacterium]